MIESLDLRAFPQARTFAGMVITDLDGTLLNSDRKPGEKNLEALRKLGKDNFIRVIATGRHLVSLLSAIKEDFPIDYVIFSSGAGVYEMKSKKVLRSISLDRSETNRIIDAFVSLRYDFMLHEPIPENHRFAYKRFNSNNPDFEHRILMYEQYAEELHLPVSASMTAAQALAIRPKPYSSAELDAARKKLSEFTVIRTTSPIDGESLWIEVFPNAVSKGKTSAWLAVYLGIRKEKVLAIGNDYNDMDMLEWAGKGIAVGNAKPELLERFASVATNDSSGFAMAVEKYLLL
jgi:Cof subfamily protein (haloacid dehalogenase superfamily)